ncbi:MAG: hypothetical protein IPP14_05700 [Planctomycetes bacterium]|nr:hypothetical protein [Planctomycetota bacterium]
MRKLTLLLLLGVFGLGWTGMSGLAQDRPGRTIPDIDTARDPRPTPDDLVVRDAVHKGLALLASIQNNDGSWSNNIGNKLGNRYQVNRDGYARPHLGVTAISCMAFMAAGSTPDRGEFKRNVAAGVAFIISNVDPETGWISANGTRMYEHAFCSMCLAEVYGMTRDPVVLGKLRNAIQFIVKSQNLQGSWRYVPNQQDSDLSICVCQLQALRAAANVGVIVPENAIEAAKDYVRKSYLTYAGEAGSFTYQIDWDPRSTFCLTAAGVVALQSMGEYDTHTYDVQGGNGMVRRTLDLGRSITYLMNRRPDPSSRGLAPGSGLCDYGFWYGHYYAAQAMYQYQFVSPRSWTEWNTRNRENFLKMQHPNGAWTDEIGGWDQNMNAYATAMACLVLSIPRGYLPVFQN